MHSNNCRVCGLGLSDAPWDEDDKTPSWEICPCCGTEFGYEDITPEVSKNQRSKWLASGGEWFDKSKKPSDWSFDQQISGIPSKYR